ncbi:hypothetical protein AAG570_003909 [Ranatra chinensis]|uniref:Kinesin motor domain-containing protein n=1 Tax=Ranatra chinensis TaxID=642074 RepID=A0ABD0Y294_9HEMI
MCRVCTNVTPGEPQVTLGSDKAFTYDYVFDTPSTQSAIYETCSRTLVQGSLEGYNATVLAYGQTGSGKTYTMGTGFDVDVTSEQVGIIPRAIHHIFSGIDEISEAAREAGEPPPQFKVTAQFLELYNEEIIDLFDPTQDYSSGKGKSGIRIHEDSNHCIYVTGVQSLRVSNAEEALQLLRQGALSRTTASTQMNSQSSRSHAIFTLHIKQQRLVKMEVSPEEIEDNLDSERGQQEFETLTAKFHFVDLAGSERLKRTGATGERAKEGISINCGLLALGNVISALGDTSKRVLHVPYRDSKLTRLLQDSLGGNSRTLMIACISPSDRDFMETLNTLKYANRARNIQNKVIINQDKSSRTITILKKEIQQLQLELLEYKQGKRIINPDGSESINDMFHENTLLQNEAENLRMRVKAMQETIDTLSAKNTELLAEKATSAWINCDAKNDGGMSEIIKKYVTEIEELRAKVFESESICTQLRKAMSRNNKLLGSPSKGDSSGGIDPGVDSLIELAKKDLQKDYEVLAKSRQSGGTGSDNSESESDMTLAESNSSESEEDNEYSKEIANLTSEISVKQRLIDELEKAQKRLNSMKQHYEDKLNQLQAKIQATQQERDTVLASFTENKQPTEKVKKIKDEYERKLTDMQKEMKSLQSAKREHAKLLRNQSQYETQIRTLNSEVMDMKKAKVKLIAKMREEAARHKEAESRRNREIAQLRKQSRLDANLIRNLEAEKRAKAAILKRKQEEVSALRKVARNRSQLNNNITMRKRRALKNPNQKWIAVEKIISENTMNRQSIIMLEREMERQIESRTELQEELKSKMALCKDPNYQQSSVLKEEIDTLRESLDHVQATITDLQQEILQVEENKISFEAADLLEGIKDFSGAAYMVDKLYNMTLNHSNLVAQKDVAVRELQAEIEQLKRQTEMQNQLLEHLLERNNKFRNDNKTSPGHSGPDSNKTSRSNSPTDNKVSGNWDPPKYRRRTALPQELLFPVDMPPQETQSALASPELMPPPPPLTRSLTSIKLVT